MMDLPLKLLHEINLMKIDQIGSLRKKVFQNVILAGLMTFHRGG